MAITSLIFFLFIYFIYGCVGSSFLCEGFSLVVASGGHSSSRCAGLSLSRPLLLRNTGSRRAGSAVVAHGPSRSAACGILPDQGSNPCPLHWQADSQPLRHQGSPSLIFLIISLYVSTCLNNIVPFVCFWRHTCNTTCTCYTCSSELRHHRWASSTLLDNAKRFSTVV